MPITNNSSKKVIFKKISYIYYPVQFQGDQEQIKLLLDNSSEVNIMNPSYIKKLDLKI